MILLNYSDHIGSMLLRVQFSEVFFDELLVTEFCHTNTLIYVIQGLWLKPLSVGHFVYKINRDTKKKFYLIDLVYD